VFPSGEYDPTNGDHVHFGNRVTDDGEGILTDLAVRGEVVGRIDKPIVDLISRNKLVDLDRPRAFDLHGIDLLIFDNEVLPLCHLVATGCVLPGDDVTSFRIDALLL
jgi:hypothetical protein